MSVKRILSSGSWNGEWRRKTPLAFPTAGNGGFGRGEFCRQKSRGWGEKTTFSVCRIFQEKLLRITHIQLPSSHPESGKAYILYKNTQRDIGMLIWLHNKTLYERSWIEWHTMRNQSMHAKWQSIDDCVSLKVLTLPPPFRPYPLFKDFLPNLPLDTVLSMPQPSPPSKKLSAILVHAKYMMFCASLFVAPSVAKATETV